MSNTSDFHVLFSSSLLRTIYLSLHSFLFKQLYIAFSFKVILLFHFRLVCSAHCAMTEWRAPGRRRLKIDHIGTPQHPLYSPLKGRIPL